MKSLISIAGFDASSGAGIVRDADTFFSFGFHGIVVPTCTVVQGPGGVRRIEPSSRELFRDTLEAATQGVRLSGMKIGALCSEDHIRDVAAFISRRSSKVPVVIDPVFAAKNGIPLISEAGIEACARMLFPAAAVVTPNIDEASLITGREIRSLAGAKRAAKDIFELFNPGTVVVKGGHLKGDPVDVLYDGVTFSLHRKKKLPQIIHGTGCSFSSVLTCFLASGYDVEDAFEATEEYLERLLKLSYRIDARGYHYISSAAIRALDDERARGRAKTVPHRG